uniref:Drug metabolite transporter superfamily n=1 Tax=Tetraselmis sp. GSL018 TaxID=582737 RepID=A0A061SM30_9CHLO
MDLSGIINTILIVFFSLSWMAVSSALILVNKFLLKDFGFHFPMALSGLGMICSSLASYFTCQVLCLVEAKRQVSARMWLTQIVPVGLFMALSLQLGNYAYLELTVAFIQMLKALCPVFTLVALACARMLVPTVPLVSSVVLISIGVIVSSYGEVNFSWIGLAAMLGSEGAEAMRLVITQLLLVGLKFHPSECPDL